MRQLLYRTGIFVWLFSIAMVSNAQQTDTVQAPVKKLSPEYQKLVLKAMLTKPADSMDITKGRLKVEDDGIYLVNDTVPGQRKKMYYKRDSSYQKSDSLFKRSLNFKKTSDSLFRKRDSLFKKSLSFKKMSDSLYRKRDSLYKKALSFKNVNDSLFRKHDSLFRKNDTLYKKSLSFKKFNDSLFKENQAYFKETQKFKMKTDSVFKKLLNLKKDTSRLTLKLKVLESSLHRLKTDSLKLLQHKQKKLISKEVDCNDDGQLSIENIGRKLTIKTTTGNKIRLEIMMLTEEGAPVKEAGWEKDFNIAVTGDKNKVMITKAGNENKTIAAANNPTPPSYRSPLTVYVPASVKITIEHKYNDLVIMDNLANVDLDLLNTKLQMKDAEKAVIKSKYGAVRAGNIKTADLDLLNCNFSAADIGKLEINSKYSIVNVKYAGFVSMESFSDQYSIAKAADIKGSKSFGQFNIMQLDNSINLNGSSADLMISKIAAAVKTIKVDNKYADVKLPVETLQNFSLQFNGAYSNLLTAYDKIRTGATDSLKATNPAVFTKTAGDLNKDFTELIVKCSSCSVDFR